MEQPYITWLSQVSIWQMMFGVWATGAAAALAVNRSQDCDVRAEDQKAEPAFGKNRGTKWLTLAAMRFRYTATCWFMSASISISPITCGVVRPKILLPVQLDEQIGETKTGLILFHELVHIKRQDVVENYLWLIAKIIYWFNPLVVCGPAMLFWRILRLPAMRWSRRSTAAAQMLEYSQGLLDVIRLSQGEIKTANRNFFL